MQYIRTPPENDCDSLIKLLENDAPSSPTLSETSITDQGNIFYTLLCHLKNKLWYCCYLLNGK